MYHNYKDYMQMPRDITEYRNNLVDAAELGAMKALEKVGLLKPYLKLAEAKRLYGPATVDRWIREGQVKAVKEGNNSSPVRIDRMQIEAVAKAANKAKYIPAGER